MAEISAQSVKQLRDITGAGMMACKKALQETQGNMEKAILKLREKGLAEAQKKASRIAKEGKIGSYIHFGGKVGVLLELNCETDFVANTDEFNTLLKDLTMQVAAMSPLYVKIEDVPQDIIEKEKSFYKEQLLKENKPPQVVEKIIEGKINKYFKQTCLLEQPFIKDETITVKEYIAQYISKLGENVSVRRFVRFEVGKV
ncbi:MAG: translation elongation factor Ts [Deltaproteobacteria bacterium]|nr:translation elongation factor Ts [Deltaproteobacteria bacterium]